MAASEDDRVLDDAMLQEIELLTEVIIASARSPRALSEVEVDRVLGVAGVGDEDGPDGPSDDAGTALIVIRPGRVFSPARRPVLT